MVAGISGERLLCERHRTGSGAQFLNVTVAPGTPLVLHVTTPTAGAGTYTNTAAVTLNAQQLLTIAIQVVNQAAPQFSNLTPSQAITFGMSSISLSGTISAGANFPPSTESVSITINGSP